MRNISFSEHYVIRETEFWFKLTFRTSDRAWENKIKIALIYSLYFLIGISKDNVISVI